MKKIKLFLSILLIILILGIKNKNINAIQSTSSYCVIDSETKTILEGNNYNDISLIASTTKILTALICIENVSIFKKINVLYEDTAMDGSKIYLEEGDSLLIIDILHGLMLRSGNDCANIIARETFDDYDLFIKQMNNKCKELQMYNSTFENPSGLDSTTKNYSTAYDMSLLMSYSMENPLFKKIASTKIYKCKSEKNKEFIFYNKHKLVATNDNFLAGKTGYTKQSGRILVSYASINNRNIVITTINDSNDWNNHKMYLNNTLRYKDSLIIKKGYYNVEEYNKVYYLNKELNIPIDEEIKKYKIIIEMTNEKGFLMIYKNNNLILKYKLNTIL